MAISLETGFNPASNNLVKEKEASRSVKKPTINNRLVTGVGLAAIGALSIVGARNAESAPDVNTPTATQFATVPGPVEVSLNEDTLHEDIQITLNPADTVYPVPMWSGVFNTKNAIEVFDKPSFNGVVTQVPVNSHNSIDSVRNFIAGYALPVTVEPYTYSVYNPETNTHDNDVVSTTVWEVHKFDQGTKTGEIVGYVPDPYLTIGNEITVPTKITSQTK